MTTTVEFYEGTSGVTYVEMDEIVSGGVRYRRTKTGPASDWQAVMSLSGLMVGPIVTSCTFNSITVEVPYAGLLGRADLYVRRVGDLAWRKPVPMWPCAPSGQQAYLFASAMHCEDGTDYDIRVDVYDLTGGTETLTATATTRLDNIETHASLLARATHYIRLDGNDANSGTVDSPSGAWKTINKARLSAPAGAVVVVGSPSPAADEHYPGHGYAVLKATPLTLVARHPALDEQGRPINAGKRAILDGKLQSGPVGAATEGVTEAPWVQQANGVWKWAGAWTAVGSGFGAQAGNAAWSATRDGVYRRVWYWDNRPNPSGDPGYLLGDPTKWQNLLLTNVTFNYGYWKDPSSDDLYLRMQDNIDPNTVWITFGHGSAFGFGAADSRFCGFVVRGWYRAINGNGLVDRLVVDRNLFDCTTFPMMPSGANGATVPADIVFERNRVRDTGYSLAAPDSEVCAPWSWIKRGVQMPGSSAWVTSRPGGLTEGMAVRFDGARRLVARHNTIIGAFNGISTDNPSNRNRHTGSEWDVHDNLVIATADDSLEPPTAGNWRVWRHRAEQCLTVISAGPSAWGPSYFEDISAWRCGTSAYIAPWADGRADPLTASIAIKYSSASSPQTRWYWRDFTFWSDLPGSNFGDPTAAGSGGLPEHIDMQRFIIRVGEGGDVLNVVQGQYSADYGQYAAPASSTRGFRVVTPVGAVRKYTFSDYRAMCPTQDSHSNLAIPDHTNVALLDAQFVDPLNGDLTLRGDSVLNGLGAGVF